MLIRLALIVSALAGGLGIAFALAIGAENLGNWTEVHPERAVVAWSLWNVGVLVLVAGPIVAWRRYRRSGRSRVRTDVR